MPLFVQAIAPASIRVASFTGLIIGVGAAAGAVGAVVFLTAPFLFAGGVFALAGAACVGLVPRRSRR